MEITELEPNTEEPIYTTKAETVEDFLPLVTENDNLLGEALSKGLQELYVNLMNNVVSIDDMGENAFL